MKQNDIEQTTHEGGEVPSILEKRRLLRGDRILWIIVAMFFAISMVVVYSATSQLGFKGGSTSEYLHKHIATLCMSAGILFACYYAARMHHLRRFTGLIYVVALLMTLAAYVFGGATNDAHRWLNLGFVRFQPSELLKIATVMMLSAKLSAMHQNIRKVRLLPTTFDVRKWVTARERDIIFDEAMPLLMPIALSCMAILPAHTSSAIHLYAVSIVLLIIAGVRFREVLKVSIVAAVLGFMIIFTIGRGGVFVDRVKRGVSNIFGKAKTEQVQGVMGKYNDSERSRMAIYNGGIFGVGAGRSIMRARLTHPESDYLFAIVVEEFGLLLSLMIMMLYVWLFFRAYRIFDRCEWLYAGLMEIGLAFLVTSQGFMHIAVNIGWMFETGQNLPFLTQGRTSMFCASIAVGLILSISRQAELGTLVPPSQKEGNKQL